MLTLEDRAKKVGLNPDDFEDEDALRKAVIEKEEEEKKRKEEEEESKKDIEYWKKEAKKAFESRDETKEERNKLRDKIKRLEDSLKDAPNKEELETLEEELKELKEFKTTIDKEREEEELKNKTELERFKIETQKDMDALRQKMEDRVKETSKTVEEKEKEIESKNREISDLRTIRLKTEVLEAATRFNAYNPSQIFPILRDRFTYVEDLDKFSHEIRDEKGKLTDAKSVEETVEEFLKDPTNENLVKSGTPPGGGTDHNKDESHAHFDSAKNRKFGNYNPKDEKIKAEAEEKGLDPEVLIEIHKKRDAKLHPDKNKD